jgi:hypothetical protein
MKEHQYRLLRLGVTGTLRPDIELQTVLRRRVAVLSGEVLPYAQPRRLGEVGEGAHWWLVRRAIALFMSISDK